MNALIGIVAVSLQSSGWTDLQPSEDSRIVYVSSSVGSDANSGLTIDAPKNSLAAGQSLIRNDYPDWLLLKRGDTWDSQTLMWKTSGNSESRKQVISSYGEGSRPVIKNGKWRCWISSPPLKHFAITDVDFYASFNDPSSPDYLAGTAQDNAIDIISPGAHDLLFEGCRFRFYPTLISTRGSLEKRITNMVIRRNVFADCRGFGLLSPWSDGTLLEENTFERNGWANRTKLLHNVYVKENTNFTARGNILSRGGNFGIKTSADHKESFTNFIVDDNLFYRTGFSTGHSKGVTGYDPDVDVGTRYGVVNKNVFVSPGKNLPFDSTSVQSVAMYLANMADVSFDANAFVHNTETSGTGVIFANDPGERSATIYLTNSVVYNWNSNWFKNSGTYVKNTEAIDGFTQTNNFPTDVMYRDPGRDLASYSKFLGGPDDSEAFLLRATQQSRDNWDDRYTAAAFNAYIRDGFAIHSPVNDEVSTVLRPLAQQIVDAIVGTEADDAAIMDLLTATQAFLEATR